MHRSCESYYKWRHRITLSLVLLLVLGACGTTLQTETTQPSTPSGSPHSIGSGEHITMTHVANEDRPSYEPRFEPAACPFTVPEEGVFECGYLVVPEDRSRADSRDVRLAVAILRSVAEAPEPDPIIFLEGGPGGRALSGFQVWIDEGWNARRDLVLFDQRGAGYSEPDLNCPELNWYGEDTEDGTTYLEAALACRERLVSEGVDLAAYHSAASAADVNDLVEALGYAQVNLLGISYGTRLALTTMRDAPQHIRSVVLDSTYPPNIDDYIEQAAILNRAFARLFDACAADAACREAYPDLERVFYEEVERLNANPVETTTTDPETGEEYLVMLNGNELFDTVDQGLYLTSVIPLLPRMIGETAQGNYDLLSELSQQLLWVPIDQPDSDSEGVYYSVTCAEELPFIDYNEVANATRADDLVGDYILDNFETDQIICQTWGAKSADPVENEPVRSAIPTLILAGAYDPRTPPEWGKLAAETLSNSFFYEVPGSGHGVSLDGGCPTAITLDFLDDPTSEPDTACLAAMGGPDFEIP